MYEIVFTERAVKDFKSLDKSVQAKILIKLNEYQENPLNYAKKLINPKTGSYRFRAGDYRIVFDVEDETIIVLRVGHRKDIYKK